MNTDFSNPTETITMMVIDKLEHAWDKRRLLLISWDISAIIEAIENKVESCLCSKSMKTEYIRKLIEKKNELRYAREALSHLH